LFKRQAAKLLVNHENKKIQWRFSTRLFSVNLILVIADLIDDIDSAWILNNNELKDMLRVESTWMRIQCDSIPQVFGLMDTTTSNSIENYDRGYYRFSRPVISQDKRKAYIEVDYLNF
jgi:hypothetical protein